MIDELQSVVTVGMIVFSLILALGLSSPRNCDVTQGESIFAQHMEILTPRDNCINVYNCIFDSCKALHNEGGAIRFYNSAYNSSIVVRTTTFTRCSADQSGGAIAATSMESFVLESCFYNCSSRISGAALYYGSLTGSYSATNTTSIANSFGDDPDATIFDAATSSQVNYVNSSFGKTTNNAGFIKLHALNTLITFNTVYGNVGKYTIVLNTQTENPVFNSINIVGNEASTGIIAFNGDWALDKVIFQQNKGVHFYKLVPKSTSRLTVRKSVSDAKQPQTDDVEFIDCHFDTQTSTLAISHLNTELCPNESSDDSSDSSVWKNKGVIGALSGGIVGAFVIGLIIGIIAIIFFKKRDPMFETLSMTPLTENKDNQYHTE